MEQNIIDVPEASCEQEVDELELSINCLDGLVQESKSVNTITLLYLNAPTVNEDLAKMGKAFEECALPNKNDWNFCLGMIAGMRIAVKSIIWRDRQAAKAKEKAEVSTRDL